MQKLNYKNNGSIYTPTEIVDLILDRIEYKDNICYKK